MLMDESGIMEWFSGIHGTLLDPAMVGFSYSATAGLIWVAMGLLLIHKRNRMNGIIVIVSVLATMVLCDLLLKTVIDRPRPFEEMDLDVLTYLPYTSSFPSTHTATAFAGAVSLLWMGRGWLLVGVAYASAVALSRIYVCVHWPTDVVAGAAIGAIIAVSVMMLITRLMPNPQSNPRRDSASGHHLVRDLWSPVLP